MMHAVGVLVDSMTQAQIRTQEELARITARLTELVEVVGPE